MVQFRLGFLVHVGVTSIRRRECTFHVKTEIVEFATDRSGGHVVIPELVVSIEVLLLLLLLAIHDDPGARFAVSTIDVEHQVGILDLDEVVLPGSATATICTCNKNNTTCSL